MTETVVNEKVRRRSWVLIGIAVRVCAISTLQVLSTPAPHFYLPSTPTASAVGTIAGMVVDERNIPIGGATVRVKTTKQSIIADSSGSFSLGGLQDGESVRITAWALGYYIGGGDVDYLPGAKVVTIVLRKHAATDNPDYQWVSAFAAAGEEGNCQNCHSSSPRAILQPAVGASALPFDEWIHDAHALSVKNIRFLTMYLGQDVSGHQSPATRYAYDRDYGRIPLRADSTVPYYGPGYKLDFPDMAGNCAACHAPAAAINAAYGTDPTRVTGVGKEGVTCDFCHKVWDVRLDPGSNRPTANMPGVLSFDFRRPPDGHQFFAGPFDDVGPGEDTYSPIQRQGQFCAPCHFGAFWNTQIYNSFGEWLDSPYSKSATGRTCQDCHMPPGRTDHFARLDKGAMQRDPERIFSHLMPGASDTGLLKNAITLTAAARRKGDHFVVEIKIVNDKTGHDVPTDSPLRQMLLLVQASDATGQALIQLGGPTIPEWGGVGDPAHGYYAGLPGKIFAKILMELWTEITPSGAYWNPTRIVSDNRIPALDSDSSIYTFSAPAEGVATIRVTLLFRRAFKQLMVQKGWDMPDIVMAERTLVVP